MADKVQKILEEVERLHNLLPVMDGDNISVNYADRICTALKMYIDSLQEENVKDRFVFKAIPRLLDMIEPSERAKSYVTKLTDAFDVEGYHTDAEIVRESLKMMNGEKVAMATMDEEPVSEDLNTAAKEYANNITKKIGYRLQLRRAVCFGANWKEEQFEKNRLKHCNSITNEQAELEQGFIDQHIDKYQRMPTFLDAIEYGMRLQKEQMMKNAVECEYFDGSLFRNDLREKYRDGDKVKTVIVKSE